MIERLSKVRPNVCALAVMTKAPLVGTSKTRLTPPLTEHEAAELSACFLRDTCENIDSAGLDGAIDGLAVYTPSGVEAFFHDLLPPSFALLGQRGNSIADRLINATEDLFSLGYAAICFIGSDSPTLPATFLRSAVSSLRQPGDRLVLGPAQDGGYYLIGLKQAHHRIFENIDWSTSLVLAQTLARAKEIDLPVTVLPEWFDIDDPPALRRLCNELLFANRQHKTGSRLVAYQAPHTRAYLSQLMAQHSS